MEPDTERFAAVPPHTRYVPSKRDTLALDVPIPIVRFKKKEAKKKEEEAKKHQKAQMFANGGLFSLFLSWFLHFCFAGFRV
jgi:hypothetical protein